MPEKQTCGKVGEFLLDQDAFGEGFNFSLPNGKEKYTSWKGVIVTFIMWCVILLYAAMKGDKVWGYGDSSIGYTTVDSYFNSSHVESSDAGITFAFGITHYDGDKEPVDDESYG